MVSNTCYYIVSEIYRIAYGLWSVYHPSPDYIEVSTHGAKLMIRCYESGGKPVLSVSVSTGIYSPYEHLEIRDVEGFLKWLSSLAQLEKKVRDIRERFVTTTRSDRADAVV